MNAREQGLFPKFHVTRVDGRDAAGEKHHGCEYFVLDLTHDRHAVAALGTYAEACADEYPILARDLRAKIAAQVALTNEFVTVPDITLPNGRAVPSFRVGKYLTARGPGGLPAIRADATPWVDIDYHQARAVAEGAGLRLLAESQALAIAWDIARQDINWTGGKVGDGEIYRGLHQGTVSAAQDANYASPKPEERRWHQLSNGERLFDFAGNAYSWIFDDVQGDEQGLVVKKFDKSSPSITTPPYPSREKGVGWYPGAGTDWSGNALLRGGCWYSGACAGVFYLGGGWPDRRNDYVGFRCTTHGL